MFNSTLLKEDLLDIRTKQAISGTFYDRVHECYCIFGAVLKEKCELDEGALNAVHNPFDIIRARYDAENRDAVPGHGMTGAIVKKVEGRSYCNLLRLADNAIHRARAALEIPGAHPVSMRDSITFFLEDFAIHEQMGVTFVV